MSTVKANLIKDSGIHEDHSGYTVTQIWSVTGLDSSSQTDPKVQALNAPGIPVYGEYYAGLPSCRCYSRDCKADGATVCTVTIVYKTPVPSNPQIGDGLKVKVGTTVVQAKTHYYFKDTDSVAASGVMSVISSGSNPQPQKGEATFYQPVTTLSLTRRERSSPLQKSVYFVGSLNADTFKGFPSGQVLCTGITGFSDDGEISYIVTYEFMISDMTDTNGANVGWSALIAWLDPFKNNQPEDPVKYGTFNTPDTGNATYFQVLPYTVFAEMGL